MELVDVSKDFVVHRSGLFSRHVALLSAVSDVSLSIKKGETFGIVGESGCGKTTLGRMMVALEAATSGHIDFEGRDLSTLDKGDLRHFRRELQMMFQDPYSSLDPRMSVGTIVREPLDIQRQGDRRLRNKRVRELLDEVGLPASSVRRHPHEFSGGQRQRIGLARALALQPKLIVADEPVSALDVSIRSQVLNLMKSLQEEHNVTYVVISHDLSVVRYLADRVGVMYLGRLVEVGTQKHVYESTAHHYTAGLLEAIPLPDPSIEHRKGGVAIKGELPSPLNPPSGCRFRTRCPHAEEICKNESPPLRQIEEGHFVACHFPLSKNLASPSTAVAIPL
jgi:peptide/nickel transport system ATP-binding protein